jgi:3-oxoacyl-[acyl-carrier protein] reductase
MGQLDGKKAIVTGAAGGIGQEIAKQFVEEGARVALLDRDLAKTKAIADKLGDAAFALKCDVAKEASVNKAVAAATAKLGGLDVMVNNAGIGGAVLSWEMSLKTWQEMIDIDLTAVFLGCKAVLPGMIAQKSGRIINTGSQLGFCGAAGMAHYCAAKGGVHSLTKSIAREVAQYGITVNAIAPGPTKTPMLDDIGKETLKAIQKDVPLGRLGKPEEIAATVVLLAGDRGGFYTGSVLNISGGHVM